MEIELKLLLDPAANDRLLQHPLLAEHAQGEPVRRQLLARYFDTADFQLRRHDAGLRVRKIDGEWLQTMKAGGGVQAGLHQRHEWEGPVARAWPHLGKLKKLIGTDAAWSAVLDAPGLAQRLQPLFAVRVERTTWHLTVGAAEIEMVLDVGAVEHGHATDPINEIELELKSGQALALFEFAQRLQQDLPLRLENSSKAERGYALCSQSGTTVLKAQPLVLAPEQGVGQALLAVFGNCLQHIQGNEAGVIHSDNTESVHQMRVGLRRLRAALQLFDGCAACPDQLQQDLGWLGGELGAARDWEVLASDTLTRAAPAVTASQHVMALQALLLERVRQQRLQAARALQSPRYTQLLLAFGAWMLSLDQDHAALRQPLDAYARATIKSRHQKLLKRGAKIRQSDARALHRTRIAGKQARYALEFFASLYRPKRVRPYLAALSDLQDELGRHNDLIVADRLLQQLEQQQPGEAAGIALVRGYLLAQQGNDQPRLDKVWRAFCALDLPAKK